MLKILKKQPPKQTKVRILFQSYNTTMKKVHQSVVLNSVFQDEQQEDEEILQVSESDKILSPFPNNGKVFIGFITHQTTGCGFHVAAQFLPTVERENIDFSDYYFKKWNGDLVFMGGSITRLYYNHIIKSFKSSKQIPKEIVQLISSLPFENSSPATEFAEIIRNSFLDKSLQEFPMIPTVEGFKPSNKVFLILT